MLCSHNKLLPTRTWRLCVGTLFLREWYGRRETGIVAKEFLKLREKMWSAACQVNQMGSTSKRAISIDSTAMKKVCAKNQCATSTTMAKIQN